MEIFTTVNDLIIQISNPFVGKIKRDHDEFFTTKPDKDLHGFGMRSIIALVERNNGFYDIQATNNIFNLLITLPIAQ